MAEEGVRNIVGRLIADKSFQQAFEADPHAAIRDSGIALEADEINALTRLKASDLNVAIRPQGPGAVARYEIDVRSAKV